ncbi:MAG: hypothetical protein Q7K39_02030 [Candidatus Magasanikbacteria bacterium]|nr:hypothetical protein [Candidatus Magasanikbacteria bacterium]
MPPYWGAPSGLKGLGRGTGRAGLARSRARLRRGGGAGGDDPARRQLALELGDGRIGGRPRFLRLGRGRGGEPRATGPAALLPERPLGAGDRGGVELRGDVAVGDVPSDAGVPDDFAQGKPPFRGESANRPAKVRARWHDNENHTNTNYKKTQGLNNRLSNPRIKNPRSS